MKHIKIMSAILLTIFGLASLALAPAISTLSASPEKIYSYPIPEPTLCKYYVTGIQGYSIAYPYPVPVVHPTRTPEPMPTPRID